MHMVISTAPRRIYQGPASPDTIYRTHEAFQTITTAWDVIMGGGQSPAALHSFIVMAQQVAGELSALGCVALGRAAGELIRALDALICADSFTPRDVVQVDQALAELRGVVVKRLLTLDLGSLALVADSSPFLMSECCCGCLRAARCADRHKALGGVAPEANCG